MPGHTCVVCGSTPIQDPDASFHCLQSDPVRRASWLDAFGLEERQLKAESQVFYTCVVCGSTPMQDPDTSFHCLQSEPVRRASWIDAFGLEERQLKAE